MDPEPQMSAPYTKVCLHECRTCGLWEHYLRDGDDCPWTSRYPCGVHRVLQPVTPPRVPYTTKRSTAH
jgi:hypothetical protein